MIIVRTTMNVLPEKQLEVMQTLLSLIETAGPLAQFFTERHAVVHVVMPVFIG